MDKLKDDDKIKREINLDRHGLRPRPNVCHLPDPPWFSLRTTFNTFIKATQMRFVSSLSMNQHICWIAIFRYWNRGSGNF
jgi:hypothetical protein